MKQYPVTLRLNILNYVQGLDLWLISYLPKVHVGTHHDGQISFHLGLTYYLDLSSYILPCFTRRLSRSVVISGFISASSCLSYRASLEHLCLLLLDRKPFVSIILCVCSEWHMLHKIRHTHDRFSTSYKPLARMWFRCPPPILANINDTGFVHPLAFQRASIDSSLCLVNRQ
jgi:hypothetical protein